MIDYLGSLFVILIKFGFVGRIITIISNGNLHWGDRFCRECDRFYPNMFEIFKRFNIFVSSSFILFYFVCLFVFMRRKYLID